MRICPSAEETGGQNVTRSLFSPWRYLVTFAAIAFVVTCSMLLFLTGFDLDVARIREMAPLTFLNILFLSALATVAGGLYWKLTVERPLRRILAQTRAIAAGDFSVRIEPGSASPRRNELGVIAQNLNTMASELSGMETLRADFVSNVSHEMKSPLAAIRSNAILLEDPSLPEEERVACARATTMGTDRMSDLVTNMLRLSKLENQHIYPSLQSFDLAERLREDLLHFESLWEAKNISIEADIPDTMQIEGDPDLLSLVWNNLFSNALKFTDEDGVVEVSLASQDPWAVVTVSDTGCGMGADTGKHIFEKFYQADSSHATVGNGLGLSLAKRVVDLVGGELLVESAVGVGSTFTFKVRKHPVAAA